MDFLGVGPLELLFVLIIAILVIGPDDLGKSARSIGRFLNRMYKSEEWKAITQASRTLRTLPNRLAREAELEELDELRSNLEEATKEIQDTSRELFRKSVPKIPQKADASRTADPNGGLDAWVPPPEDSSGTSDEPVDPPSIAEISDEDAGESNLEPS